MPLVRRRQSSPLSLSTGNGVNFNRPWTFAPLCLVDDIADASARRRRRTSCHTIAVDNTASSLTEDLGAATLVRRSRRRPCPFLEVGSMFAVKKMVLLPFVQRRWHSWHSIIVVNAASTTTKPAALLPFVVSLTTLLASCFLRSRRHGCLTTLVGGTGATRLEMAALLPFVRRLRRRNRFVRRQPRTP